MEMIKTALQKSKYLILQKSEYLIFLYLMHVHVHSGIFLWICVLVNVQLYFHLTFFSLNSESIFGYKDLTVEMYYTAAKLTPFINLQYITKIVPELHEGLQVQI